MGNETINSFRIKKENRADELHMKIVNKNLKHLISQIIHFLIVSGIGWLIDFGIYTLIAKLTLIPVAYGNMLSGIPALTFVFAVSTRKIFQNRAGKISLWVKYLIYFSYQMILLFLVSHLCEGLFGFYQGVFPVEWNISEIYIKVFSKVCITPITMVCNFCVMKVLSEKI